MHHFTLFLLWCLKLLVAELSAESWEGKALALEMGVPQCSLGGCLLHSTLGHTSAAGLCHLILTQHQETPLPVSCGDWRQRQVGLCQCSCFPHGQVRARCWCSLEVSEQRCKVSAQLLGCFRERSMPLHFFCLLSSFWEQLWGLDRAGTLTESFPSFSAVCMKVVIGSQLTLLPCTSRKLSFIASLCDIFM